MLRWSYQDVIERSVMSLAADKIANEIRDDGLANHFRFHIRNREALDALRAYFRFLDQTVYHLYEVSGRSLLPVKVARDVSFQRLERAVATDTVGGSRRFAGAGRQLVQSAKASFKNTGWQLVRNLRNVDTHRYVVGIDHITYISRSDSPEELRKGGRLFTVGDSKKPIYSYFGEPDIRFETIEELLRIAMRNAKAILTYLSRRRLLVGASNEEG